MKTEIPITIDNNKKKKMLLDALYCDEAEQWEEEADSAEEIKNSSFLEKDEDEEELMSSLLEKEQKNVIFDGLVKDVSLSEARCNSVEWMLRVISFFSFSSNTALLAVNYLDRFLCSFQSHHEDKPWMIQLASVACLSLAAKVEETQVPLLLDFQVEECKYVFEAKTIQRMEMLILSTLEWKMNPVTPHSFLDLLMRRLRLKTHLYWEFLRRSESLLLFIISDCRFTCYLPSVLATATMLHVMGSVRPFLGLEHEDQLLGILRINKDKVDECFKLISDVGSNSNMYSLNKRKLRSGSPKGVMDLLFSSDSSNDSWSVAGSSVSSSPEPMSKKIRLVFDDADDEHANFSDVLSFDQQLSTPAPTIHNN